VIDILLDPDATMIQHASADRVMESIISAPKTNN
jgi:hypothetical protein